MENYSWRENVAIQIEAQNKNTVDQYSIESLKKVIADKNGHADYLLSKFVNTISDRHFVADLDENQGKIQYVVDLSEEKIQEIESGRIKLCSEKGKLLAQFRDEKGRYSEKIPIKKEVLEQNELSEIEIENALQYKAIQQQLLEIVDVLNDIQIITNEIRKGQQNDRVALFFSGQNLYQEARVISDDSFRKLLLAQSIKSLSDAYAQLVQEIREDILFVVNREYNNIKNTSRKSAVEERIQNIHKCFELINRSAVLKAFIYYENNEPSAMLRTIDEYGVFLKTLIVPNALQLSEHDPSDRMLYETNWERRANTLAQANDLEQLLQRHEYYLMEANYEQR